MYLFEVSTVAFRHRNRNLMPTCDIDIAYFGREPLTLCYSTHHIQDFSFGKGASK